MRNPANFFLQAVIVHIVTIGLSQAYIFLFFFSRRQTNQTHKQILCNKDSQLPIYIYICTCMVASFHLTTDALKSQYFLNLFCSKLQKITAMAFGSRQPEQLAAVSKNVGMNNLPPVPRRRIKHRIWASFTQTLKNILYCRCSKEDQLIVFIVILFFFS